MQLGERSGCLVYEVLGGRVSFLCVGLFPDQVYDEREGGRMQEGIGMIREDKPGLACQVTLRGTAHPGELRPQWGIAVATPTQFRSTLEP